MTSEISELVNAALDARIVWPSQERVSGRLLVWPACVGACQGVGGHVEAVGDARDVQLGALEQLGRDDAGDRNQLGVAVAVWAGQHAGEDVAGVERP